MRVRFEFARHTDPVRARGRAVFREAVQALASELPECWYDGALQGWVVAWD